MQSIIIIKFILLRTDQFQVLPEGLVGAKGMDVYHGSYFGFNSLPKNAAEPWMDINIAVLEETHTQQPQGCSSHATNQQNGNSRAVNRTQIQGQSLRAPRGRKARTVAKTSRSPRLPPAATTKSGWEWIWAPRKTRICVLFVHQSEMLLWLSPLFKP